MSPGGSARVVATTLAIALGGCGQPSYEEIDVDSVPVATRPAPEPAASGTLRFSVASMLSPHRTHASYSDLLTRIGEQLGVEVQFVQRRTYAETNRMLVLGTVDAALICTGGYVALLQEHPSTVEIVAVPVIDGLTTYRSVLIVPRESDARSLLDMRGRRFAFTDELSLGGYAACTHELRQQGIDPDTFFGPTIWTRSHDRSVLATSRSLVDGACVDNMIYDRLVRDDPALGRRVREVHRTVPYGIPPLVASTHLPVERRRALRDVLLHLHEDSAGRASLAAIGVDRFVVPTEDLYESSMPLFGAPR